VGVVIAGDTRRQSRAIGRLEVGHVTVGRESADRRLIGAGPCRTGTVPETPVCNSGRIGGPGRTNGQ
jgi:hypothetical protein